MKGKAAVAGISLLLVVGVIVGVIATAGRNRGNDDSSEQGLDGGMVSGMKAVETLCAPTDFKEVCKSTLAPTALKYSSATPRDLVEATFQAIKDVVKKVKDKSVSLTNEAGGDVLKARRADGCRELMDDAIYDLDLALSRLVDSDTYSVARLSADFKNWIGAVIAYKSDCADGIANITALESGLKEGLVNTTQLTYNALAIIDEVTNIISKINGTALVQLEHRQLLDPQLDNEGYPRWVSAADRRLLKGRKSLTAHVTVAKDGSGNFKTIQEAVNACPDNHHSRFIIHVKDGTYRENVVIHKNKVNVLMYGDNPKKTIVTGDLNMGRLKIQTWQTATFAVDGNGFIAMSMGFHNTAGPEGEQAVALRTQSDFSVFYNCRIEGHQDTLAYQAERSFFRNCIISGTVDFIFGHGTAVIQNSTLIARLGRQGQQNVVTADGREHPRLDTGLVIQGCKIVPHRRLVRRGKTTKSYLGRPWKALSRTMIMQSTIEGFIEPEGWLPYQTNERTCKIMEYDNKGPGADVSRRINWPTYQVVKDRAVAEQYTAAAFIQGGNWLKNSGVPFNLGLSP